MAWAEREWAKAEEALKGKPPRAWNNTAPQGMSYRDHLKDAENPKSFVAVICAMGAHAETHSSLACLFNFVGFSFTVNNSLVCDTARIGGTTLAVENL